MKKIFFGLFVLILCTVFILPGSIQVISPKTGDIIPAGKSFTIKWKSNGNNSGSVKINIFKNSILQKNFVQQINGPDTGTMKWVPGKSCNPGKYVLRIKSGDGKLRGDSGIFTIAGGAAPPPLNKASITIKKPAPGEGLYIGSTCDILWTKTGQQHARVKINVFRNSISAGNYVEQMTGPNTGSMKWSIANTFSKGTYLIRIKTEDGKVHGDSRTHECKYR